MLGAHDIIGTTICLPGDDSDLRHGCFSIGKEQLSPITDYAVVLLVGTWSELGEEVALAWS